MKRIKFYILICAAILIGTFSGCTETEKEKIIITVLHSDNFESFEKLVETEYQDIDLQYEKTSYPSEQLRRLEKGVGPDLVVLTQPSAKEVKKFLLDIGDTQASTAYDGTVMKQLQMDGNAYLLPLPGQYSGYIINETLFDQAGLTLPASNQELSEDLAALKAKELGVGEDGINFSIFSDYNAAVGMYYTGYMVPDFLGKVEGLNWLGDFRRKEATFKGSWDQVFSFTDQLVKEGLLDAAAMGKQHNAIRYKGRMANGTLAVLFGNSSLYRSCVEENEKEVKAGNAQKYSYRMLPLLSDQGNEPWIILSPSAYIGINAASDEEKQEACKRVLELLSTPEGQEAVVEDLEMGVSYLRDYQADTELIPEGLEQYTESGYVYNIQFPDKIVEYLGSQARQMLAGKITAAEALAAVDDYYYNGSEDVDYDLSVVGKLEKDLLMQNYNVRLGETEIGNLVADSVAEASGVSIAVVNGGGIRGSLYQGEVYGEDLAAVCPYDNMIVVLEMKGQTVWDMLENSLSAMTYEDMPGGRFLQVSGLSYVMDSSKAAGARLAEVKLADGSELDLNGTYQVAVNDYMAGRQGYAEGNGDDYKMLNVYDELTPKGQVSIIRETGLTYRDALAQYFESHKDSLISADLEGRITNRAKKQS